MRDLRVDFPRGRRQAPLRAVHDVSFDIEPGQTVGLVGESGSGKSTIGRSILGLVRPTRGEICFDGHDLGALKRKQRRALSSRLQVVFQDPYSSLSPTQTIGETLRESLSASPRRNEDDRQAVNRILGAVGLPAEVAERFPSAFSGGQRQRIAIARALVSDPQLVICDEPVSALDLSVQAQVLNLIRAMQEQLGVSYLFISHDLPVVRYVSHHLLVLYKGQVMERGSADQVYEKPLHPYTMELLEAIPEPTVEARRATQIRKAAPTPSRSSPPPDGCPFAPRCSWASTECFEVRPVPERSSDDGVVACHHWRSIQAASAPLVPGAAES